MSFCQTIISDTEPGIKDFLTNGLTRFQEEVLLFIDKNDDDGIFDYSNEQTFASLFVNGLIRKDLVGEITALQEYATTFPESLSHGRPDIFINYKKTAIWIECKLDKSYKIEYNHWDVTAWLEWDELAILKQANDYYEAEKEHINDSFIGGNYIMTLVFKLIKEDATRYLKDVNEKLKKAESVPCKRPWFYSVFFLDFDNSEIKSGIEVYGTIMKMK